MRALAELFVRRGIRVTGCDQNPGEAADLSAKGIQVLGAHARDHAESARAMVVSSAIQRDIAELKRARELNVPVIRRAEALGEAVSGGELVGVAGTHGKTTTTVMTTTALTEAGLAPTGIVGGRVAEWDGNLSDGGDRIFVVESDEYDRSFLALTPTVAVVTNIERDHMEIYRDVDDLRSAFAQFVSPARFIVLCADDPNAARLPVPNTAEVIRYGTESADARLVARNIVADSHGIHFDVLYDNATMPSVRLRVPGTHNVRNALAAIAAGIALGANPESVAHGLYSFRGVDRRFQVLGDFGGVTLVDDYAHHPTEISATLQAARSAFPGRRIIIAFQPHLFTRTRDFHAEFAEALSAADETFLLDIYPAREQPIPGVDRELISRAMRANGKAPVWEGARPELAENIARGVQRGDVVLTVGAGDITHTAAELRTLLSTT
jgi:UDP-N-acetylmuramate--alanine ligase